MLELKNKQYYIKSVENALIFLNALVEEGGEFGITSLSEKLGMHKNNIFRLMATFEKFGYVEQIKGDKRYKLGFSAYETGQKILSRMKLLNRSKPVMEKLAKGCNETVYLVLPAGREFLMLEKVETTNPVRVMSLVGRRYPLPQSAAGKVILAYSSESKSDDSAGEASPTREALEIIWKRGICEDADALGAGIASLAVPLLNEQRRALGCLCFVGPRFRFTRERVQRELIPPLKAEGQRLSAQFGCLEDFMA